MRKKKALLYAYLGGLFVISVDQLMKYLARTNPSTSYYLWDPWIGWEFFANSGVAFGLPVPQSVLILLTPIILLCLAILTIKKARDSLSWHIGFLLIITGAVSNFIDRVLFSRTIDYLRIFTSVINLADISILVGFLLLLLRKHFVSKQVDENI